MGKSIILLLLILGNCLLIVTCLILKGQQARHIIQLPFRTVKFIDNLIFFTTNNGRYFGYIDTEKKGSIEVIYELEEDQRIMDEFSMGAQQLIIGNKNKTIIRFDPISNNINIDNRLVGQHFNELKAFKQVNNKTYIMTERAVLFYKSTENSKLQFVKQLLSNDMLNDGVTEIYHDLYFFPTRKFPERIVALTSALFQKGDQKAADKFLSCFKWFLGQNQQVDGKCTIESRLDIQDFRITGKWAYLRMPDQTYVYDEALSMKTKWDYLPTQYIAGHAVMNHLTYLFKTNELAYYRLVQNFANDDVKMTSSEKELFITKKGKKMIKLNKPESTQVIGTWLLQFNETNFKMLIQYDKGDLHCYKITKNETSTQINYLFRQTPNSQGFDVQMDGDFYQEDYDEYFYLQTDNKRESLGSKQEIDLSQNNQVL